MCFRRWSSLPDRRYLRTGTVTPGCLLWAHLHYAGMLWLCPCCKTSPACYLGLDLLPTSRYGTSWWACRCESALSVPLSQQEVNSEAPRGWMPFRRACLPFCALHGLLIGLSPPAPTPGEPHTFPFSRGQQRFTAAESKAPGSPGKGPIPSGSPFCKFQIKFFLLNLNATSVTSPTVPS